jgi:hypothetical protein
LWGFINHRSPKGRDLLRDGRYAIHAFPNGRNDDELMIDGRAVVCEDEGIAAGQQQEIAIEARRQCLAAPRAVRAHYE